MKRLFFALSLISIVFCTIPLAAQQILINEIMASNAGTMTDEDGASSDWIELYNNGSTTVNLEGWGFSDNSGNPFKWIFPRVSMAAGQYLLVWASGKDRNPAEGEKISGIVREVYTNITGNSISNLTNHPSYPDKPANRHLVRAQFEAPTNVSDNYGQRMHGLIRAPQTGNYTFWLASDDNGQLWLSTNDSRTNVRQIASVPVHTNSREWGKYSQQKSATVFLEKDKYYYIMALMKEGIGGDNLAVGWQLPDGTYNRPISGEYLFWPEGELHTNFSISAEGEAIMLTSAQGNLVDEAPAMATPADISWGRLQNDNREWGFFAQPTPGKANTTASYQEVLRPPVFSHTGGFYGNPFQLSLSTDQEGVTIVYTIDGSHPSTTNLSGSMYQYLNQYRQFPSSFRGHFMLGSFKSNLYASPFTVRNRSGESNQISGISSTYEFNPPYIPSYAVDKAFVVKARAFRNGALSSETVSHTYFVTSGGVNPYSLPIVAISAQENELFDFDKGIYVAGVDFENWRTANPNSNADGGRPANYHRDGDEWEYPAHLEFFEKSGNRALGQNIGIRIHGGWSRSFPFKSLRIYARNAYGASDLNYPFFEDQDDDSFKRLLLRNSGNDNNRTMFRDAFMQEMVKHMDFETQSYQPSIVFLNGEYWGIQNIRERQDKYYLARKFELDAEQLDILENNMGVDEGDNTHYVETLDFIRTSGVQSVQNYAYVATRIDIESYIDYMLSQIFFVNTDWPGNNIKFWRLKTDRYLPAAGSGKDGRWRWLMYDTDFGFGLNGGDEYTRNMLNFTTTTIGPAWPNPEWSTFLFRKMLENETFRTKFIVRFTDQLNTAFKPLVVKAIIDRMAATLTPEMARHIQRWKIPGSLNSWQNNIQVMRTFADLRPGFARTHLRQHFSLDSDYLLTVDVSGSTHGHVVVNTIPIQKETAGVSENPYPWQGVYFRKVPLRLEAKAAPGHEFVRWESGSSLYFDRVIELQPDGNQHYVAVFKETGKMDALVHYWNFNHADTLLEPTYTLLTAGLGTFLPEGGSSEVTFDSGQGFSGVNTRFSDPAGTHLRVNNPLGVKLTLDLPTTGFSKIKFGFESRRSGQGAGTQIIEYTTNGQDFTEIRRISAFDDVPAIILVDFEDMAAVNDNPNFKIRISFERGSGGTAGNNRFDNITLSGLPNDGTNVPPIVMSAPGDIFGLEGSSAVSFSLSEIFYDQNGDELTYTLTSRHPEVGMAEIDGDMLKVNFVNRGETVIHLTARDQNDKPVSTGIRVLVYPEAVKLAESDFSFTSWDPLMPEMTFPQHMLFLQSGKSDPSLSDPLEYAYYLPAYEYADVDSSHVGFPYQNTSRTRLNGLGAEGLSMINTGRDRDLGGVLLAINTTGVNQVNARWLAGTLLRNSRSYGITLQYRTGYTGEFTDLPETFYGAAADGHVLSTGPIALPAELAGQEYVQLLWRYHYLTGESGARSQLRVDDIHVGAVPAKPVIAQPLAGESVSGELLVSWNTVTAAQHYEMEVSHNSGFNNPLLVAGNLHMTEFLLSILENHQDYYVRVRAVGHTYASEWSDVVYFNTWVTSSEFAGQGDAGMEVYPNPFSQSATLNLTLPATGTVQLGLYTFTGTWIKNIFTGDQPAGRQTYRVDGAGLRPGTYLLVGRTSHGMFTRKMVKLP